MTMIWVDLLLSKDKFLNTSIKAWSERNLEVADKSNTRMRVSWRQTWLPQDRETKWLFTPYDGQRLSPGENDDVMMPRKRLFLLRFYQQIVILHCTCSSK